MNKEKELEKQIRVLKEKNKRLEEELRNKNIVGRFPPVYTPTTYSNTSTTGGR